MELKTFLNSTPKFWVFVPVSGKRPLRPNWQSEEPIDLDKLEQALDKGENLARADGTTYLAKYTGVGLRLGRISRGVVALDFDGGTAKPYCEKLAGCEVKNFPKTLAVTSGGVGRFVFLYKIPEQHWNAIETKKFTTGEREGLEFRWDGLQQVVWGQHPSGRTYQWVKGYSPEDTGLAIAPDWVIKTMLTEKSEKPADDEKGMSWTQFDQNFALPINEVVPLTTCLAPKTREALEGKYTGGRNDAGIAIARDLIGTANHLTTVGQPYSGDPHQLFTQWCSECGLDKDNPKGQPRQIWRSAEKGNPRPALSPEMVEGCIKTWAWKNKVKIPTNIFKNRHAVSKNGAVSTHVSTPVSGSNPCRDSLLADCHPVSAEDIKDLRVRSFDSLELSEFLPPYLAEPMAQMAQRMPTAPEALLTSALAVFASLIGAGASVRVKGGSDSWIEPCVLWTQNVARTGSMKTATQNVLIGPLRQLQDQADKEHKLRLKDWKASKAAFDKDKAGEIEDPGEEPKPREYFISDATIEAIADSHRNNPTGFLMFLDELDGLFGSFNKYRNGAGDDEQTWLSFNSGGGIKKARMNYRISLSKTAISITGSTQPETIAKHIGTDRDTTGMNARWLYCVPRMPLPYLDSDNEKNDIEERLLAVYRSLTTLSESRIREDGSIDTAVFSFSSEAFEVFKPWANGVTDRWAKESHQGFASSLIKFKGYTARLALVLHTLASVCNNTWPDLTISAETVSQAIKLAEYYIGQSELVFKGMPLDADGQDLTPVMLKLIDLSEKTGWITTRIACRQSRLIKNAQMAHECFEELTSMGIGETRVAGQRKEWRVSNEWLSKNGKRKTDEEDALTALTEGHNLDTARNTPADTPTMTGATVLTGANRGETEDIDLINKEEINNISFSNTPASKYTPTPQGVDSSPPRREDWRVWTPINTVVNVLEFGRDRAHIRVPGESKTKWVPASELKEG